MIDAHQHFWVYDPARDRWMTDELHILRKNYLPQDLLPLLKQNRIEGTVLVQADPSEEENHFLLKLASENDFIRGIVGWIDLQSDFLEERLKYYGQFPVIKGFRHLLQGEKQRDLMLNHSFQRGIGLLSRYGYSFDLLVLPDQLGFCETLAKHFPEQRFVIDHLAKPLIRKGFISDWMHAIQQFKTLENVYCKISGMVTEADWKQWRSSDFINYMDVVLEVFGSKRIMFGSDWPVCLVASSYHEVKQIAVDYFNRFSEAEKDDFYKGNATRFYHLV